jgi:hypothetical protein
MTPSRSRMMSFIRQSPALRRAPSAAGRGRGSGASKPGCASTGAICPPPGSSGRELASSASRLARSGSSAITITSSKKRSTAARSRRARSGRRCSPRWRRASAPACSTSTTLVEQFASRSFGCTARDRWSPGALGLLQDVDDALVGGGQGLGSGSSRNASTAASLAGTRSMRAGLSASTASITARRGQRRFSRLLQALEHEVLQLRGETLRPSVPGRA